MKIKKGIYKHYKGHVYKVIGVAKHSENLEELVVYIDIHDEDNIWVRPISMFFDKITKDEKKFKRFEFIKKE